jgi:hypothetical protein
LIIAIDCLLVPGVDNATTGLHLRRWPREQLLAADPVK